MKGRRACAWRGAWRVGFCARLVARTPTSCVPDACRACAVAHAQFSAADVPRLDGRPPHLGLCRRGFNLIGKIQPVLIGWNVPDGVERWHNQAAELPEVGSGVREDGLLKLD